MSAAEDSSKLLPWALTAIGVVATAISGVVTALWLALRASSLKQMIYLEKQVSRLEGELGSSREETRREREQHELTKDRLGDKIDAANLKAENVATLMMRSLTIEQIREFDDPRENTTVTRAVTMAKAAIVAWDPTAKTPI